MAIAFDALGSGNGAGSINISHTVSGSDRILVVCVTNLSAATNPVDGDLTYNGTVMALQNSVTVGTRWVGIYTLIAPDTGANSINATVIGSTNWSVISASYTGVAQTGNPESSTTNSDGTAGTTFSITDTSTTDNGWHVASFQAQNTIDAGASTTKRGEQGPFSGSVLTGMFDTNAAITPAGSNTLNFTCANSVRSAVSVIIKPSSSASEINISETSTLAESVHFAITKLFQESVTTSELVSVARLVIISIVETISWVESFVVRLLWTRRTPPSTSWSGRTQPSTLWDDRTQPSTTWTPRTPPS